MTLQDIKKYGMTDEEIEKTNDKDKLLAHISHLEDKVNVCQQVFEVIASEGSFSAEEYKLIAQAVLEKINLRNWKKK